MAFRSPCWSAVVPIHAFALGHGAHRVERGHSRHLHVGDEDVLVGGAAHLEPLRLVAERGDGEEVVALTAGEGDGEPAIPVGADGSVHATGDGGRGDVRVREWIVVVAGHLTADDIELLGGGDAWKRDGDGEEGDDVEKETAGVHEYDSGMRAVADRDCRTDVRSE